MKKSAFTLAGRICGSAKRGYRELRKAFTLAEVLITLTIIGVIAAITVPTLIQNTQKQEYVSALKKAYSTLSQATQQIIMEEGSPKCSEGGWACSPEDVYNLYRSKLNILKDCSNATDAGCFYKGQTKLLNGNNYTDMNVWHSNTYYRFVLADGMSIAFDRTGALSTNCSWATDGKADTCERIFVDVNGVKQPNIFGRDVFVFDLKENGLVPEGINNNAADCISSSNGWTCACKVLREGAMNY